MKLHYIKKRIVVYVIKPTNHGFIIHPTLFLLSTMLSFQFSTRNIRCHLLMAQVLVLSLAGAHHLNLPIYPRTCTPEAKLHPPEPSSLSPDKCATRRSKNKSFFVKSKKEMEEAATVPGVNHRSADKLRSEFRQVLCSRFSFQGHIESLELSVETAQPVSDPLYQVNPRPTFSEAMESCPREEISNFKELVKEENLYLITEAGEQGRLPLLILSMKGIGEARKPAVVFLHSTSMCKEWLRPLLEAYASRGYVAVAIDSRYHGERASTITTYKDALVSAWRKGDTMPFIFDTTRDLIKLADYLIQREDIDPTRIGITGESLGGMHAWFAAFAEPRYAVVVPIIGVQGFRWAIDNDEWQARADSIRPVFEEAQKDLGKSAIDKEVVEKVWNRIAPGLASRFDSPLTIPALAPRPLLIVNGAEDPRCPLRGLELPESRALKAYEGFHCLDKFKLIAEPGIGHRMTSYMVKEASDWFDKFLKQ